MDPFGRVSLALPSLVPSHNPPIPAEADHYSVDGTLRQHVCNRLKPEVNTNTHLCFRSQSTRNANLNFFCFVELCSICGLAFLKVECRLSSGKPLLKSMLFCSRKLGRAERDARPQFDWLDEARTDCAAPNLSAARLKRAAAATAGHRCRPGRMAWQRSLPPPRGVLVGRGAALGHDAQQKDHPGGRPSDPHTRDSEARRRSPPPRHRGGHVALWGCGPEQGHWSLGGSLGCGAARRSHTRQNADALHEALTADLEDAARPEGALLVGSKLDIRKCFDTVDTGLDNTLLKRLGAPSEVIDLMHGFDALQELMAAWGAINIRRLPQAKWNIYLDNGVLWCRGERGIEDLRDCLDVSREFEQAFGLRDPPGKRELLANTPAGRKALRRASPSSRR